MPDTAPPAPPPGVASARLGRLGGHVCGADGADGALRRRHSAKPDTAPSVPSAGVASAGLGRFRTLRFPFSRCVLAYGGALFEVVLIDMEMDKQNRAKQK